MKEEKARTRSLISERLESLSREDVTRMSAEMCAVLSRSAIYGQAEAIFCYRPMDREIDFLPLLRDALSLGKRVCFPRIREKEIDFRAVEDIDAPMELHRYGIEEPPLSAPVMEPSGPGKTLILVPGMAFDRSMRRLGRGGGFYDRYLLKHRGMYTAAGTCFSVQIVSEIPVDPWDLPVDLIVTERGIVSP